MDLLFILVVSVIIGFTNSTSDTAQINDAPTATVQSVQINNQENEPQNPTMKRDYDAFTLIASTLLKKGKVG